MGVQSLGKLVDRSPGQDMRFEITELNFRPSHQETLGLERALGTTDNGLRLQDPARGQTAQPRLPVRLPLRKPEDSIVMKHDCMWSGLPRSWRLGQTEGSGRLILVLSVFCLHLLLPDALAGGKLRAELADLLGRAL